METVENLVNISQPMIKEKNIDFSFHITQMNKEYLYTDQLRLNQIYINILSNAIKYTEPGGRVGVTMREEKSDLPNHIKGRKYSAGILFLRNKGPQKEPCKKGKT